MDETRTIDPLRKASHDLRGALSSILGFSSLLTTDWDKVSDDDKQQFVGIIERQARRMSELVDALVAVARDAHVEVPASDS